MMMFSLYVQQNQWIIVTLLAGAGLTILLALTYFALWRPRKLEEKTEEIKIRGPWSFFEWLLTFTPWAILLVAIILAVFAVTYLLRAAGTPPNW